MHGQSIPVLLVEDNPGDAGLVRAMLQDASVNEMSTCRFGLTHARRLQEALELLGQTQFAVVLLDLGLPDSQGINTLFQVRNAAPGLPIVIMSGLSDATVALQAVQQGAQDYLVKDRVDEYLLARAIHYAIERSQAQAKVVHINQVLRAIRDVNQLIVHEKQRDQLIQRVCDLLVSTHGFSGAWLVLTDQAPDQLTAAHAGFPDDTIAALVDRFQQGEPAQCAQGIQTSSDIVLTQDPSRRCTDCALAGTYADMTALTAGLYYQEQHYGYLGLSVPALSADSDEERQLLVEIAGDIAFALHSIETDMQRQQAEARLQAYSEHLEEMVTERTRALEQAQSRLVEQERISTLGHLATGLAHEMRNPLGAIKNAAYLLNMVLASPAIEVQTAIEVLQYEVDNSEKIINGLLDFANPRPPVFQVIDLNRVVRQAIARAPLPPHVNTRFLLAEHLPLILADPRQIGQILDQLVLNAVQAMSQPQAAPLASPQDLPQQLTIATRQNGLQEVIVSIQDTGVGIASEHMARLFEPLFTTKAKGLGLGLARVHTLVQYHSGRIEAISQVGQGSTFAVYLPVEQI